jgi:hypothetical protein
VLSQKKLWSSLTTNALKNKSGRFPKGIAAAKARLGGGGAGGGACGRAYEGWAPRRCVSPTAVLVAQRQQRAWNLEPVIVPEKSSRKLTHPPPQVHGRVFFFWSAPLKNNYVARTIGWRRIFWLPDKSRPSGEALKIQPAPPGMPFGVHVDVITSMANLEVFFLPPRYPRPPGTPPW